MSLMMLCRVKHRRSRGEQLASTAVSPDKNSAMWLRATSLLSPLSPSLVTRPFMEVSLLPHL